MKRSIQIALAIALVNLFFVDASNAQTSSFTYQGRLNNSGAPANGIYDLRFAIYDAVTGGTNVTGVLTNAATVVSNGLFTVQLDFGASPFNGSARWLDIGVRTNGSTGSFTALPPRQPITATPYAIQAANASTASVATSVSGSVSASQLTGAISSNNIGAGSITGVMLANGAVSSNNLAAGSVTTAALANDSVTAAKLFTTTYAGLAVTLTNPIPVSGNTFGNSVAGVGSDKVLISVEGDETGAVNAGAVRLFNTNGVLLTTFTNPAPTANDFFGKPVAVVGSDKVLIGAPLDSGMAAVGSAYLFSTNGTLLTTFTNPTPTNGEYFGSALAGVGSDKVLIGAYQNNTSGTIRGVAYLFSTNGLLLTTFTNPTPGSVDYFGYAVAAVGSDKVLIGAYADDTGATDAGAAYLFSTNGTLLTTFTNPTPAANDYFGSAVAAVGSDKVLIGAYRDDTGWTDAGAAYLFSTNGMLLTTFTNPTPAGAYLGSAVAAVGPDKVLIGVPGYTLSALSEGAAYLFSTNGTLLTTITNPTPEGVDQFGLAVAAVGSDKVVIAAPYDNTGGSDAGTAYLFSILEYAPGVTSEGVKLGSITTASIADGAITQNKLHPSLSTNLALLNANQTFSGANTFSNASGNFSGSGSGLTNLNASSLTSGTVADFRLSTNVVLRNGNPAFTSDIRLSDNDLWLRLGTDTNHGLGWYGGSRPFAGANVDGPVLFGFSGGALGSTGTGQKQAITWDNNQRVGLATGTNTLVELLEVRGFDATIRIRNSNDPHGVFIGDSWGRLQLGIYNPSTNVVGVVPVGGKKTFFLIDENGAVGSSTNNFGNVGFRNKLDDGNGNGSFAGNVSATAFNISSDRNVKDGFTPVDATEMLAKVAGLPITRWHFTNEVATQHIGPMAQDFHGAFGVGMDDKHIATVDADGVALAAIQGLNQKVDARSREIDIRSRGSEVRIRKLETENAELKKKAAKVDSMEQRLLELERLVKELATK